MSSGRCSPQPLSSAIMALAGAAPLAISANVIRISSTPSCGSGLVDVEAYDAARGHGTPIEHEIDSEEETTEAKIRRRQIQWSHVPVDLAPMVERYIQLAVFFPKEFGRLFAAAFLTPPRGWQARLQQQRSPV
jgi:hypothetical protein